MIELPDDLRLNPNPCSHAPIRVGMILSDVKVVITKYKNPQELPLTQAASSKYPRSHSKNDPRHRSSGWLYIAQTSAPGSARSWVRTTITCDVVNEVLTAYSLWGNPVRAVSFLSLKQTH